MVMFFVSGLTDDDDVYHCVHLVSKSRPKNTPQRQVKTLSKLTGRTTTSGTDRLLDHFSFYLFIYYYYFLKLKEWKTIIFIHDRVYAEKTN